MGSCWEQQYLTRLLGLNDLAFMFVPSVLVVHQAMAARNFSYLGRIRLDITQGE